MGTGLLGRIGGWVCEGRINVDFGIATLLLSSSRKPYGGDPSAEGAYDPGGGGGNKFKLLDITEE